MSIRNKTFESIAIMLNQNINIERSLIWVLAIVRGRGSLALAMGKSTLRDLVDSLQQIGREPSRRGLLSALLSSQLEKITTRNHN